MTSAPRGKNTSDIEVTNISKHGFWLLVQDREQFLAFEQFPWFKDVPVGQLRNVALPHPRHLYWPDLDFDLAVESIEYPERFPLVSKACPKTAAPLGRRTATRRLTGFNASLQDLTTILQSET